MDAGPTRIRGRFQFSLRTLMLVLCIGSASFGAWVNYARNWIGQRHEWLEQDSVMIGVVSYPSDQPVPAPSGLWLLGESGVRRIGTFRMSDEGIAKTKSLFPEARIIQWVAPPK